MVSIVIPYTDELNFLEEALASAKTQFYHGEIILVCNAEFPTGPLTYAEERITVLHEPIPGSAFARNRGLYHASGEWIQFLDADDLLMPDKILHQLDHSDADVIVSRHLFQRLDGQREPSRWISDDVWTGLLNSGLGSTSSMLWRTESVRNCGGWSPVYQSHQEYELLFRMLKNGAKVAFDERTETIVRQRASGSITLQTKNSRPLEGIRLREQIWNYLLEKDLDTPSRKNAFLHYVFRQLRGLYRIDRALAKAVFKKHFSDQQDFSPDDISLPLYKMLYKYAGFSTTERIIAQYALLRDRYFHFLPKNN